MDWGQACGLVFGFFLFVCYSSRILISLSYADREDDRLLVGDLFMVKRKDVDRSVSFSVRRFINQLREKGIPIQKAIIFGSWARGVSHKDSDIDLCLVSPKFGRDELKDLQFLLKQTRDIDDRIEPLPLSVADFENDATPLVLEIKKYGREVEI